MSLLAFLLRAVAASAGVDQDRVEIALRLRGVGAACVSLPRNAVLYSDFQPRRITL